MSGEEKKKGGFLRRLFGFGGKKEQPPEEQEARRGEETPAAKPDVAPEAVAEAEAEAAPRQPEAEAVKPEPEQVAEPKPAPEPEPESRPEAVVEAEAVPEPEQEAIPEPEPEPEPEPRREKGGWLARLRKGLSKSSSAIGGGITGIFTRGRLDEETLQDLEDILIQADLGVDMAERVIARIRKGRYEKGISPRQVKEILAQEVAAVLEPVEQPLRFDESVKPFVVLVVGVNGSGKTTTIGKLAAIARDEGHSAMLVAADTFRAAAVEQLKVWAGRTGASFMSADTGADAAALAYDALEKAKREDVDIVFVDTAGRLQNRRELMDELAKVVRVMKKVAPEAPHAVLLVLDATVGQNAMSQVEAFREVAGVTGLVMTKLDGTARGGILVAIAEKHGLPVHAIGVGEKVEDLQPFDAGAFARAIAGLDGEDEQERQERQAEARS